jgi:hypothetical protein
LIEQYLKESFKINLIQFNPDLMPLCSIQSHLFAIVKQSRPYLYILVAKYFGYLIQVSKNLARQQNTPLRNWLPAVSSKLQII